MPSIRTVSFSSRAARSCTRRCGPLFGDEAVTQIVKTCQCAASGVYKFVYGATAAQRTVLRSATDLLLDAMREFDENERDGAEGNSEHVEKESS